MARQRICPFHAQYHWSHRPDRGFGWRGGEQARRRIQPDADQQRRPHAPATPGMLGDDTNEEDKETAGSCAGHRSVHSSNMTCYKMHRRERHEKKTASRRSYCIMRVQDINNLTVPFSRESRKTQNPHYTAAATSRTLLRMPSMRCTSRSLPGPLKKRASCLFLSSKMLFIAVYISTCTRAMRVRAADEREHGYSVSSSH